MGTEAVAFREKGGRVSPAERGWWSTPWGRVKEEQKEGTVVVTEQDYWGVRDPVEDLFRERGSTTGEGGTE